MVQKHNSNLPKQTVWKWEREDGMRKPEEEGGERPEAERRGVRAGTNTSGHGRAGHGHPLRHGRCKCFDMSTRR